MKLRLGRKNAQNLYIQSGDEPSDDDRAVGHICNPTVAYGIVEAVNAHPLALEILAVLEEVDSNHH